MKKLADFYLLGECRLSRLLLLTGVDGLWSDDVSGRRDVAREGRRGRLVGRRHCRIHRRKGRSLQNKIHRRGDLSNKTHKYA